MGKKNAQSNVHSVCTRFTILVQDRQRHSLTSWHIFVTQLSSKNTPDPISVRAAWGVFVKGAAGLVQYEWKPLESHSSSVKQLDWLCLEAKDPWGRRCVPAMWSSARAEATESRTATGWHVTWNSTLLVTGHNNTHLAQTSAADTAPPGLLGPSHRSAVTRHDNI